MCCGSRRAAWRSAAASAGPSRKAANSGAAHGAADPAASPVAVAGEWAAEAPRGTGVTLRYAGTAVFRVRGPVTGQAYEFSAAQPVQAVDFRDAAVLARSARFS